MGPAPNHPRDALHILTQDSHELVVTRNVTWLDVSERVSRTPETAQMIDVTLQQTQARQESMVSYHYSEDEDEYSGSAENSNTPIGAE